MSSTQSPSPIAAPIDLDMLKGLFGDTAPADPPPPTAPPSTTSRPPWPASFVFKSGVVDEMFTTKLTQLAATVARLQQNFDTVSVALVMFDGEKYIDPATQQPIPEYRPDWVKLSAKYTELLTTSRKFAGTIQFRATKYRKQILPALKNPKLSKADKLKSLDWFLKDTAEDLKEGGAHEDIEKDEKTALFLSQGFADLALAVRAFQASLSHQIEKVGIALNQNIVDLKQKRTGLAAGAGIGAALFGGGVALALCATGILAPIGIAVAVVAGLAALGLGGGALYEHLKVIADAEARLATAEFDLHAAQEKEQKFLHVIKPALETANTAMNNIAKDLGAIASIFTHITNDAYQARKALQDCLDDETPEFARPSLCPLKEGVHELTTECFAKLGLALEAFAAGCDAGLGPLT
ncbi:hypothetical protein B0H17DRAFT_1134477 [Mycena rosella]|uniref:Uncharacterized protein n=1 Tax=Mycena rosella TaxID=1033263 RepID=A0AAD7BMZ7_MYCRO|nr:hypothetical protein B0H17DRAFT_1151210 [Mycena rosella]KAJ7690213.1 hypothetical protein B0H17DRAFT_1134477 [Mycena rosella]